MEKINPQSLFCLLSVLLLFFFLIAQIPVLNGRSQQADIFDIYFVYLVILLQVHRPLREHSFASFYIFTFLCIVLIALFFSSSFSPSFLPCET